MKNCFATQQVHFILLIRYIVKNTQCSKSMSSMLQYQKTKPLIKPAIKRILIKIYIHIDTFPLVILFTLVAPHCCACQSLRTHHRVRTMFKMFIYSFASTSFALIRYSSNVISGLSIVWHILIQTLVITQGLKQKKRLLI